MNLTANFTLEELTRTDHAEFAAENLAAAQASGDVMTNLAITAALLEKVRDLLGVPLTIHSGFRCAPLNAAVGSNPNSQHLIGQACDFTAKGSEDQDGIMDTVKTIQTSGLPFHQLLIEGACVHIGTHRDGQPNGEVAYWKAGVKQVIQEPTA